MRRSLPLVVALALALALPAGAFARPGQNGGGPQQQQGTTQSDDSSQSEDSSQGGGRQGAGDFGNCMGRNGFKSDFGADFNNYRGTITAVDTAAGAVTATVDGQSVTFSTDDDTTFYRNGDDATIADLKAGDRVEVLIVADEGTSDADAQTQPAWSVSAYAPKNASAYSFAGKVTSLGDGTITVKLRYATPAARTALGGAVKGTTLTFATSDSTQFRIRNQSGTFSDVAVGDLVAIGIGGSAGASKEEILATPADAVLDLKKKSSAMSTPATQSLAVKALKKARSAAK
jgi:Cu/Ag efflux protein CusF